VANLPEALRLQLGELSNQTAERGDVTVFQPLQNTVNWAGNVDTGPVVFDRLVRFSPRGEAMWENGMDDGRLLAQPYFTYAIGRTIRGKPLPNDGDIAAVLLGGFTGRVNVVRP
jgi:hypothetical protein